MGRIFNVAGDCKPNQHYMVDISSRVLQISEHVYRGEYFVINRARQYGKTTTLRALKEFLKDEFYVISMDFQIQMSNAKFRNENTFSVAFAKAFIRILQNLGITLPEEMGLAVEALKSEIRENREELELVELFQFLSEICNKADRPLVLMIDEVDSASNNQVFLDFLAQLRGYYIDRDNSPTFRSVILAGVYDIRNLRRKFRPEEDHKINSPWNIAVELKMDMSFSAKGIASMLEDYENDWHTGMDIQMISNMVYEYTSGYPFLVSRLCKLIDEQIADSGESRNKSAAWTREGVLEAVKMLLEEKNPLFESMTGKLNDYPRLKNMIYLLLFRGQNISYSPDDALVDMALMFGFVKVNQGNVEIANRIFETRLYNMFLTQAEVQDSELYRLAYRERNQFVQNGNLDMERILEKFVAHFQDVYGDLEERFCEEEGRRYFLLYLKPIINGTGNYYIESQTRNMERTDVIVDYHGEQMMVELKIWRGNAYNERGEKQLAEYLAYYHQKKGYMLSFNFNKKKETGVKRIILGDKILIEAIV